MNTAGAIGIIVLIALAIGTAFVLSLRWLFSADETDFDDDP